MRNVLWISFICILARTYSVGAEEKFFLYLPDDVNNVRSVRTISFDVGQDEFEYVQLNCKLNQDKGYQIINYTLDVPDDFMGNAQLLFEQNYRVFPINKPIIVRANQSNPIWIKFDFHNVNSGEYKFVLKAESKTAGVYLVNIHVKVCPIKLPKLDNIYINSFWSSFCCIFGEGKLYSNVRDEKKMLKLWEVCLDDLKRWGVNFLEVRFITPEVIKPFIGIKEFKNGYLPVLDLSRYHLIVDPAVKVGMKHIIFRYGFMCKDWLPEGYKEFSEEKKDEVQFFVLDQLMKYYKSKGFKRIFWYLIDEIQPYAKEIVPVCKTMEKYKKRFPELEFSGSGMAHIPLHESHGGKWKGMQDLANYLTWIAPYWNVHSVFKWARTGEMKLLPNTIMATQISADHKNKYEAKRRFCWLIWKEGCSGYQIYGYHTFYPNDKYSPVFRDTRLERPIHSPCYFGLVDGYEDFAYLHLASRVLSRLERCGQAEKAKLFRKRLSEIISDKSSSILVIKYNPPVYYDRGRTKIPYLDSSSNIIRRAKGKLLSLLCSLVEKGFVFIGR